MWLIARIIKKINAVFAAPNYRPNQTTLSGAMDSITYAWGKLSGPVYNSGLFTLGLLSCPHLVKPNNGSHFRFTKKKSPSVQKDEEKSVEEEAKVDSNKAEASEEETSAPNNDVNEASPQTEAETKIEETAEAKPETEADSAPEKVKPAEEEKKPKKTTKDKLMSSLSFLKKKSPKKVAAKEDSKEEAEAKDEEVEADEKKDAETEKEVSDEKSCEAEAADDDKKPEDETAAPVAKVEDLLEEVIPQEPEKEVEEIKPEAETAPEPEPSETPIANEEKKEGD